MWNQSPRRDDAGIPKPTGSYQATPTATAVPTFHCGAAVFHLQLRVAVVNGQHISVRPQEARLLTLLFESAGGVVTYGAIISALYGERMPSEPARARLKSLVADLRKRFGPDLQAALLTARSMGLVLRTNGRSNEASEPCTGAATAFLAAGAPAYSASTCRP